MERNFSVFKNVVKMPSLQADLSGALFAAQRSGAVKKRERKAEMSAIKK